MDGDHVGVSELRQLTRAQVDAFYEQGFVLVKGVFTAGEMDEIDEAFERLHVISEEVSKRATVEKLSVEHAGSRFTYTGPGGHVRHIAYCGNAEPVLLRYGRDARLMGIAGDLLGVSEMDHLINQAHYKRPGSGIAFDWHQDSTNRKIDQGGFVDVDGRGSYVQMALALDDATAENGPLEFIEGSNKLGHLGARVLEGVEESRRVAPAIKRGDVVAFGPYTVHGSQANHSAKSRRVFINGFAYPGANRRSYGLPNSAERVRIASERD
jgi:ectoine hydroxylase-related dioxygenase (phytanoyl-CoA dioxygenase family)